MKRVLVFVVLLASGCAHSPAKIYAHCQRWATTYLNYGTHANPAAYREDLISTCMAIKNVPYEAGERPLPPDVAWINLDVSKDEFTKTFGRDKANCIERAYVGQTNQGSNSSRIAGYGNAYGSGLAGNQSGTYKSAPAFDQQLFVACMNAAGWELAAPDPGGSQPER